MSFGLMVEPILPSNQTWPINHSLTFLFTRQNPNTNASWNIFASCIYYKMSCNAPCKFWLKKYNYKYRKLKIKNKTINRNDNKQGLLLPLFLCLLDYRIINGTLCQTQSSMYSSQIFFKCGKTIQLPKRVLKSTLPCLCPKKPNYMCY